MFRMFVQLMVINLYQKIHFSQKKKNKKKKFKTLYFSIYDNIFYIQLHIFQNLQYQQFHLMLSFFLKKQLYLHNSNKQLLILQFLHKVELNFQYHQKVFFFKKFKIKIQFSNCLLNVPSNADTTTIFPLFAAFSQKFKRSGNFFKLRLILN